MSVRRRFPRAPLKIPVKYGIREPAYTGKSRVIGEGGMYVEGEHMFYKGTSLVLHFRVPGHSADTIAEGKVVWTIVKGTYGIYQGPGMGIEFTSVDPESRSAISRYVQEKKETLTRLLELLQEEHPPMKEINNLLTRTYIVDYTSLDDLRHQVKHHLKYFEVVKPEDAEEN